MYFRFITVLYYLNEPEEGGETAFPLADMSEDLVEVGPVLYNYATKTISCILDFNLNLFILAQS